MRTRTENESVGYDWIGLLLFISLLGCGWAMIFASEYNPQTFNGFLDLSKNYGKQLLFIGLGACIFGGVQLLDTKTYETFAPVFYAVVLVLLVGVLFTKPINGSRSWFELGGFRLQPSEFGKFTTALLLATHLARTELKNDPRKYWGQALAIIGLPMLLVLAQGDLGSTLVFVSFSVVLFRAGFSAVPYVIGVVLAALSIISLKVDDVNGLILIFVLAGIWALAINQYDRHWKTILPLIALSIASIYFYHFEPLSFTLPLLVVIFLIFLGAGIRQRWQISLFVGGVVASMSLFASSVSYLVNNIFQKHQQERIWVWLRPEKCDPLGALYNVEQSKYAIGSGGAFGKGFLQGERTKLDYVPEQSTDFIYCTVGEEWGFLGSFIVLGLFFAFLLRLVQMAERQRQVFTRYYIYAIIGILFFHLFINVGMTIGLFPVVGIPLPFVSYGGSSLWTFTFMMSILFKLDSDRIF